MDGHNERKPSLERTFYGEVWLRVRVTSAGETVTDYHQEQVSNDPPSDDSPPGAACEPQPLAAGQQALSEAFALEGNSPNPVRSGADPLRPAGSGGARFADTGKLVVVK